MVQEGENSMGEGLTFDYYYGMLQADQYSFYRIPKVLFACQYFKALSCEAKILYGLLLDRMSLSVKNRWFDSENRVYIIFTIEEVMESLSCSRQKAVKTMAELDTDKGIGLVEKRRLGMGKANILYVKNFVVQDSLNVADLLKYENQTSESLRNEIQEVQKTNSQDYENRTSRSAKNRLSEVPKIDSNYTNFSDTEFNYTESHHIISGNLEGKKTDALEAYREVIHDNIGYEAISSMYSKESIDEIVELILEIVSSKKGTFRISGDVVDANIVKGRFMKLGYAHMQYVCECLAKNRNKVTNMKQYLLTTLYNAPATMSHYYQNVVNHDMYGEDNQNLC